MSKKLSLPPFVIFQDPSLEDMAIQYPVKLDELHNIVGVGTGKAKKYGQEFVKVIKEYVEDKDILRPQDMVVKSVVNKSGVKVYIIQNIDRKLPLDDIAHAKNMGMRDLIEEIEAIVNSGTKLNIDYYVEEIMDEEKLEEIYEYFREAETESIDEALVELGEEYFSEEEIRLVRIKFFSELAN
jgi:ATP-dependent DNA helicase RecQ